MSLNEYKERLKLCFGVRFLDLRDLGENKFHLILKGSEFTNLDWNNINQIGFSYHIGFHSVEFTGHLEKCLRVNLRAY